MTQGSGGSPLTLDGAGLRIGIVAARFNPAICEALAQACIGELRRLQVSDDDIEQLSVPGALEIPSALQCLAESGRFDAMVAIGAVIRGETFHFEVVANESAAGVMRVALDYRVPIANAILTTENEQQARARVADKGADAARAAVEMCKLFRRYR